MTRAYGARFSALTGVVINGDARFAASSDGKWRVDTDEGLVDAENAVVALGRWSTDVVEPLGAQAPLVDQAGDIDDVSI